VHFFIDVASLAVITVPVKRLISRMTYCESIVVVPNLFALCNLFVVQRSSEEVEGESRF